jgi:hypothetical protein
MITGLKPFRRVRHGSSRMCRVLDGLIVAACIGIIFAGIRLYSVRAERMRLEKQVFSSTRSRADIIARQVVSRYHLPDTTDFLDILNDKLAEAGFLDAVMDITPGTPAVKDGVTGWPVRVRLAPVPGTRLSSLLNAVEHQAPRFMMVSLQMTRIRSGDNTVDITMNLIMFHQVRVSE